MVTFDVDVNINRKSLCRLEDTTSTMAETLERQMPKSCIVVFKNEGNQPPFKRTRQIDTAPRAIARKTKNLPEPGCTLICTAGGLHRNE